jgi:hypothetical protein
MFQKRRPRPRNSPRRRRLEHFGHQFFRLPCIADENFPHAAGTINHHRAKVVAETAVFVAREQKPELFANGRDVNLRARGERPVFWVVAMTVRVIFQNTGRVKIRIE